MKKNKIFSFPVEDELFKTSSYTNPGGVINRCVRVAKTEQGVAVRDSKDKKRNKTTLFFTHEEWTAFIDGAKESQFD